MDFYYCRADEAVSAYAGVSIPTIDATYNDDWLCDMRAARPARSTTGGMVATITALASGEVGIVAVGHHNLDPATNIVFSGGFSATLTTPADVMPDGIPFNPWAAITPVNASGVVATIAGNSQDVVVGEIIFGKLRRLPRAPYNADSGGFADFSRVPDLDLASIPGYDTRLEARFIDWTCLLTTEQLDEAIMMFKSQRNKTRPLLMIPDILKQDAWICFADPPKYSIWEPGYWQVTLAFREVPRVRW